MNTQFTQRLMSGDEMRVQPSELLSAASCSPEASATTYLRAGLPGGVGAHKLHKLLKGVLVVMVANGGVGEVRAGLLDDRGGGEVQG